MDLTKQTTDAMTLNASRYWADYRERCHEASEDHQSELVRLARAAVPATPASIRRYAAACQEAEEIYRDHLRSIDRQCRPWNFEQPSPATAPVSTSGGSDAPTAPLSSFVVRAGSVPHTPARRTEPCAYLCHRQALTGVVLRFPVLGRTYTEALRAAGVGGPFWVEAVTR